MNVAIDSKSQPRNSWWSMFCFGAVFSAVIVALIVWWTGATRDFFHALEESRMVHRALVSEQKSLTPQLREYLKSRLYWNAAVWIPKGWLSGMEIDFGPIDEKLLGDIAIAKDGTAPDDVYRAAMKKHDRVGK